MNDYEHAHITDDSHCSACGCPLDLDDLKYLDFREYRHDQAAFDSATTNKLGSIRCPGCKSRLSYEVSS